VVLIVPAWGQTIPNFELFYAQAANGLIGSQTYVTTLLVSNPNSFTVQGFIDSFDHANPANPIGLGFTTGCGFDPNQNVFTIAPSSSCQFVSSGQGALKTGWLMVSESSGNNDIGGYLAYTLYQGDQFTGVPITTVGVSPTPVLSQFSLPVVRDAASNKDIGFAMANPFGDGPVSMLAQLVNANGNVVEQYPVTLGIGVHKAEFLSQFFTTLATASNFVGNLFVTQLNAQDGVIATGLLQQGAQLGGAPPTMNSILTFKGAPRKRAAPAMAGASRETLQRGLPAPQF
jgi:hypothetical protein